MMGDTIKSNQKQPSGKTPGDSGKTIDIVKDGADQQNILHPIRGGSSIRKRPK